MQMSTTHSSFDQYCISHKAISHQAAAAPGPEWQFQSLPLLTTNPGDATEDCYCLLKCAYLLSYLNSVRTAIHVQFYVRQIRSVKLIYEMTTRFGCVTVWNCLWQWQCELCYVRLTGVLCVTLDILLLSVFVMNKRSHFFKRITIVHIHFITHKCSTNNKT